MSDGFAIAELAIGESRVPAGYGIGAAGFDMFATVISQYANSPVLLQLIDNLRDYIDPTTNIDTFFLNVMNIDTAIGWGLDVWGRIVGVRRVLHIPTGDGYFGFGESADALPFNYGVFYNDDTLTANFSLSDDAFRRLIFAKALANICDGSIPAINQILINLFTPYGNCYVTDGGDMTMTYTFGSALSQVDFAIVSQSGVLPRPVGVAATIVQL